jgi:hypothetical protein
MTRNRKERTWKALMYSFMFFSPLWERACKERNSVSCAQWQTQTSYKEEVTSGQPRFNDRKSKANPLQIQCQRNSHISPFIFLRFQRNRARFSEHHQRAAGMPFSLCDTIRNKNILLLTTNGRSWKNWVRAVWSMPRDNFTSSHLLLPLAIHHANTESVNLCL